MRVVLGVEYFGVHYFGWQKQQEVPSIQAALEKAIAEVAAHPIEIYCAGRTDARVHATYQVIHFDTHSNRPLSAWIKGVNAHLPNDIAVMWSQYVVDDFHARFSALSRTYRYIIFSSPSRPAILSGGVSHYHYDLHAENMNTAAQYLVGEHDFSSFRAAHCQSKTPYRNIHHIRVVRQASYIIVEITANAFVYHMVRNIVGALIEIGKGDKKIDWMRYLLKEKNRNIAPPTAKPSGLYLVNVCYPKAYHFPMSALGPVFLSIDN